MIIPVPRERNELVVPDSVFHNLVTGRLRSKFGLRFPAEGSIRTHVSESVKTYGMTKQLQAFLTEAGYSFTREKEDSIKPRKMHLCMRLDQTLWRRVHKISLTVRWNEIPGGVVLGLETRPLPSNGSEQNDLHLVRLIKQYKVHLHSVVEALLEGNGEKMLTWNELGIEPSVRIGNVFTEFEKSFPNKPGAEQFIRELARNDPSFFHPSPYCWSKSPERRITDASLHVPDSTKKELLATWTEELRTYTSATVPFAQ